MGKPVDSKQDGKYQHKIVPSIRESFVSSENENFVKMVEDPLVFIK